MPLAAALRDALADVDLARERLPALQQILPELALGAPKPSVDEIEVLEALVALLAEHAPVVLLLDDLHVRRPSNARGARLPAPTRGSPRSDRHDRPAHGRIAADHRRTASTPDPRRPS